MRDWGSWLHQERLFLVLLKVAAVCVLISVAVLEHFAYNEVDKVVQESEAAGTRTESGGFIGKCFGGVETSVS